MILLNRIIIGTYINDFVEFPHDKNNYVLPLIFSYIIDNKQVMFIIQVTKNNESDIIKIFHFKNNRNVLEFLTPYSEITDEEIEYLKNNPIDSIYIPARM